MGWFVRINNMSKSIALQITKAKFGTPDSWRDVTAWVRGQTRHNKLSLRVSQPFKEIGGDPAFGRRKKLIIHYRLDGVPRQLSQVEDYPVGFELELPSQGRSVSARAANRMLHGKKVRRCFRCRSSNLVIQFEDGTTLGLGCRGGQVKATICHTAV